MYLQQGISQADRVFWSVPITGSATYRFVHGVDQMQLLCYVASETKSGDVAVSGRNCRWTCTSAYSMTQSTFPKIWELEQDSSD